MTMKNFIVIPASLVAGLLAQIIFMQAHPGKTDALQSIIPLGRDPTYRECCKFILELIMFLHPFWICWGVGILACWLGNMLGGKK